MRHASQLCRGLAEAARSIDRPYLPRHVPLPSSSYSAVSQTTASPSSPRSSAPHRESIRPAALQDNVDSPQPSLSTNTPQASSSHSQSFAGTTSQNGESQHALFEHPRQTTKDRNRQTKLASSIDQDASRSESRQKDHSVPNADQHAQAPTAIEPRGGAVSKSSSLFQPSLHQPSLHRPDSAQASSFRGHPELTGAQGGLRSVMTAYQHLSQSQASLLLRALHQIKSLRSHAPSAVLAWYEDFVWTTERQAQGSGKIETAESLSLLLRYAYQRNDLRSLLRIERRAERMKSLVKQSRDGVPATVSIPRGLGGLDVDGVSVWPRSNENPLLLAYNLKIAFAAREGNWVKIEALLNDAKLVKGSFSTASRHREGLASAGQTRSTLLNTIGWGALLRYGLGNVQKGKHGRPETPTAFDLTGKSFDPSNAASKSADSLLDVAQEQISKAIEVEEEQMQAKLSVSKRLLPDLLRYTTGSTGDSTANAAKTSGEAEKTTAKAGDKATPAWLLQSVLTQLAERGEAASTTRIVQLALSEQSIAIKDDSTRSGGSTAILNSVLVACQRNYNVNLAETLRIFNHLSSSHLGQSILGPAVLSAPTLMNDDRRQKQPQPMLSSEKVGRISEKASHTAAAEHVQMIPNEESLVLILKKVRHPLLRASRARRLVAEFEQLFPKVNLSGRTYRMIIDKCVAPASVSTPKGPDTIASTETTIESLATGHIVASGRRGRRLRQEAATPFSSRSSGNTATLDPAGSPQTGRGPIVKQSILSQTLDDILQRFNPDQPSNRSLRLHLSTTNRLRFEHTLLRAKRALMVKKASHLEKVPTGSPTTNASATGAGPDKTAASRMQTHHLHAVSQIDALLDRLAQVQRLGRRQEARSKKQRNTQPV